MEDVGQGNDGEENNLASLSFGSDTEYLAETYVIVDSEVKQNGSLEMGSLLRPGIIRAVMSALDEQFVEPKVFFRVFTRYLLARGQLFHIMIEDLLKHKKDSQNNKPHLVLSADVLRLRHIARKRMGYLRAMYHLFKDTVSETEKDNRALVKSHMKMCVKHYHALIPQLDLIATQWGVNIEDTLSHDELGSRRLKREKQRRQGNLQQQLRKQAREPRRFMIGENIADPVAGPSVGRPQQKSKTSAPNYAETLEKFRAGNKDRLKKGRETKGLLIKAKEDLRLPKRQLKSHPALPERQINHPQELQQVPGGSDPSRQGSDVRASTLSTLKKATTTASDIGIELLQVLKNTTASSSAGKFGRKDALLKENPERQTFRAFNHSLTTQWDVLLQDQGLVREYYRVKESNKGQFAGVRMNYHVWRQRFIDTVHYQRRLIF
jgi:hypothetical protein